MITDHARKGYCKNCGKIRKIYLDVVDDLENIKIYKCYFCDSKKVRLQKHRWKPYGNHKKKNYNRKFIDVITNSPKCNHTKRIREYSKEDPKVKRKFRKKR